MKFKYLFLLFFTFAVGISVVWWNESSKITVEKINQLIEKEIPQEASFSQVKSFLATHEISSSNTLVPSSSNSDFFNNPKLNGKKHRIKTLLGAIIRDTEQELFKSWGISLNFYFDEQGKLVEYTVRKYSKGM